MIFEGGAWKFRQVGAHGLGHFVESGHGKAPFRIKGSLESDHRKHGLTAACPFENDYVTSVPIIGSLYINALYYKVLYIA